MINEDIDISNEEEPNPQEFPMQMFSHKEMEFNNANINQNENEVNEVNEVNDAEMNNAIDININDNDVAIFKQSNIPIKDNIPLNPESSSQNPNPPNNNNIPSTQPPIHNPSLSLNELYHSIYNLSTKPTPSDFNNINQNDLQSLSYSYLKHLSKIRINKNESFMIRMLFDIMKRQSQEKNLSLFLHQTKAKMKEDDRIKGFNRLIEDANRRLEAQEKLDELKKNIETQNLNEKPTRRYKSGEWKEIYEQRFKKFQTEKEEKIKKKINERKEMERQKEEEEVRMCKGRKAPRKVTESYGKRLYDGRMKKKEERDMKGKEGETRRKGVSVGISGNKRKPGMKERKIVDKENNENGNVNEGNNDNETINEVINSGKMKGNKERGKSFVIPKLNPADFIFSNDDININNDININTINTYTNNNPLPSSKNQNHDNSNILSDFFTKNKNK